MAVSFEELVSGCTAAERDALAWHLATMRAKSTYLTLRAAPSNGDEILDAIRDRLHADGALGAPLSERAETNDIPKDHPED